MVLGAVTGTPRGPKTAVIAPASIAVELRDPGGVGEHDVHSAGVTPASASASSIALRSPGSRPLPGRGSKVAP